VTANPQESSLEGGDKFLSETTRGGVLKKKEVMKSTHQDEESDKLRVLQEVTDRTKNFKIGTAGEKKSLLPLVHPTVQETDGTFDG